MIEKIFSGGTGVKLSTIHKAKGSEADVVWILDFDKLPYKHKEDAQEIDQQEINLVYVATTRAKKEMNFILSREEFRQEYYGRKEHNAKRLVDNKVTKINKQVTMAQTIKKILDR
jgi:superfamily I DNA/RNA helicase